MFTVANLMLKVNMLNYIVKLHLLILDASHIAELNRF